MGRVARRLENVLGVVGVIALVITYSLITGWNPVPGILDWLARAGSVSNPEPAWRARLGTKPEHAIVAGPAVVVVMRDAVEARDAKTGDELWSREAPWAALAGADASAVVVVGRGSRGYEAVEPSSGKVRWDDAEASGVWTYRDLILALTCAGSSHCTLVGRAPADGQVRWRTRLPGGGKALAGVNRELPGNRDLTASALDSLGAAPTDAPQVLGIPLGGKVQVVETETGRRLSEVEAGADTRVVVVGGRVLHSRAQGQQGRCRYVLEARDPATGQTVWRKEGYDLRTASGVVCEQRRDPAGGAGTVVAVRGDDREVLLSAGDGRELWLGAPGERAMATDGYRALMRSADGRSIKAVDLGAQKTLWEHPVADDAKAGLTRNAAVIISDGRVRALEPGTGLLLLEAHTIAQVIGAGPDGIVLASGRTVGLLPFGPVGRAG
jgi:outer membrane protein assembly factor BamB